MVHCSKTVYLESKRFFVEIQFCMPTVVWQSKTPIRKFRIFHVIMSITCVNLVFFFLMKKKAYLENINFSVELQFSKWRLESKISLFVLIMENLIWVFYPTIFHTITKYGNWVDVDLYFTCKIHMWKFGIYFLIDKNTYLEKKLSVEIQFSK